MGDLHRAIANKDLKLAEHLIQSGANINEISPTYSNSTPLILALKSENLDAINLLLDHGVDVSIESDDDDSGGPLNIALTSLWFKNKPKTGQWQDVLSSIWSSRQNVMKSVLEPLVAGVKSSSSVSLPSLVTAACLDIRDKTDFFSRIIDQISDIDLHIKLPETLRHKLRAGCVIKIGNKKPNCMNLLYLEPELFQQFVYKFHHILDVWCYEGDIANLFGHDNELKEMDREKQLTENLVENLYFLVESGFLSDDDLENLRADDLWIFGIFIKFSRCKPQLPSSRLNEFVMFLLSHGLINSITSHDFVVLYEYDKRGELFKNLLFMSVEIMRDRINVLTEKSQNFNYIDWDLYLPDIIVNCALDFSINSREEIVTFNQEARNLFPLLEFFADVNLKNICLENISNFVYPEPGVRERTVVDRITNSPNVPLLLELARNRLRVAIVEKYKTKTACQFYTVLNELSGHHRHVFNIMSLIEKLYPF